MAEQTVILDESVVLDSSVILEGSIDELQLRLTGGGANQDPRLSLGGATSAYELASVALGNLFDDVSAAEALAGRTEYRALSIVQPNDTAFAQVTFELSAPTTSPDTEVSFWLEGKNLGSPQQVADELTAPDLGAHGRFQVVDGGLERSGTAQGGGPSTITLDAGASAVDDYYSGLMLEVTLGMGRGQRRRVVSYVGATRVATMDTPWGTQPDATSEFALHRRVFLGDVAEADNFRLWGRRVVSPGAGNLNLDVMTMWIEGA